MTPEIFDSDRLFQRVRRELDEEFVSENITKIHEEIRRACTVCSLGGIEYYTNIYYVFASDSFAITSDAIRMLPRDGPLPIELKDSADDQRIRHAVYKAVIQEQDDEILE